MNKSKSLLNSLPWWLLGSQRIRKPFWLNHDHWCLPSRGRWTLMSRQCDLQRLRSELICLSPIFPLSTDKSTIQENEESPVCSNPSLHMYIRTTALSISHRVTTLLSGNHLASKTYLWPKSVETPCPPQVLTKAHIHMGPCCPVNRDLYTQVY